MKHFKFKTQYNQALIFPLLITTICMISAKIYAQNAPAAANQQVNAPAQPQEVYVGQPVGRKVEGTNGRGTAQKYFTQEKNQDHGGGGGASGDNILMLHLGRYIDTQAYSWAPSPMASGVGQANYGVTYLFDQWHGMDLNIRVDYSEYDIVGTRATKLSFLPLISFPKTETRFPLYFGIGAGPGIFMQQVKNKSSLSFDYQLVVGLRFQELIQGTGAFIEFGMKNHLHILSEGQLNGMTFAFGPVFNF
jgi:hypothetical protein